MTFEGEVRDKITHMASDVQGGPSLQHAIQRGRARRRRRAVATVASGVAAVCVVAAVVGASVNGVGPLADDASHDRQQKWGLAVPPEDVPQAIERAVRDELPEGATITSTDVSAFGGGSKPLPEGRWHEATSWYAHFELGSRETLSVGLTNGAKGDTEGNDRANCAEDDTMAFYSCRYSELATGEHVMTKVMTAREDGEVWRVGVNPDKVKPGKLWFLREVEIQPGGAYKIVFTDSVNVETRAKADAAWTFDVDAMRKVISHREFLDNPASE